MRYMHLAGSPMYCGAKRAISSWTAPMRSSMGRRSFSSKMALRGVNHSRSLFLARSRRNWRPSRGKPGNVFFISIIRPVHRFGDSISALPEVLVLRDEPLAKHTRFGIGGPADLFIETANPESFVQALGMARASGLPVSVIGGGTNLVV